jgi:hypothetical protein
MCFLHRSFARSLCGYLRTSHLEVIDRR